MRKGDMIVDFENDGMIFQEKVPRLVWGYWPSLHYSFQNLEEDCLKYVVIPKEYLGG